MIKAYKVSNNSFAMKACEKLAKDRFYAPTAEKMLGIINFCLDLQLGFDGSSFYIVVSAAEEKLNHFKHQNLQEIDLRSLNKVTFIEGIGTPGLLTYVRSL